MGRWHRSNTVRALIGPVENVKLSTKSSGAGNVVNINIKTSKESLSENPEAIPLQDLDSNSTKTVTLNSGGRGDLEPRNPISRPNQCVN